MCPHKKKHAGPNLPTLNIKKYIIYTPIYREDIGGVIVLHKLCSLLLEQGYDAKIWPIPKPHIRHIFTNKSLNKFKKWYFKILPKAIFGSIDLKSPYDIEIAKHIDLRDSIVVYPETVCGNPLHSQKCVRWLLNKPGKITGKIQYGENDLIFFFDEHFNDLKINPNKSNHLRVIELMNDVYFKENYEERCGTCYMVRKGFKRDLSSHDEDSIKVDDLSHKEASKVFNKCKYFISYDAYTMYSTYAAMCGCIPIVIPEPGVPKEQWRPRVEDRYGIAYGWDDVPWAIATRDKLLNTLAESRAVAQRSVRHFVEISQAYFDR